MEEMEKDFPRAKPNLCLCTEPEIRRMVKERRHIDIIVLKRIAVFLTH
jgi:hypothetical protein